MNSNALGAAKMANEGALASDWYPQSLFHPCGPVM